MAHSIQVFRSKHASFNDLDLMVIVSLLESELARQSSRYGLVRALVGRWKADLVQWGPGTIDLRLQEIDGVEGAREQLLSLIGAIEVTLDREGGVVPADFLNSHCSVPGIKFNDYPISVLKQALLQLKGLMT